MNKIDMENEVDICPIELATSRATSIVLEKFGGLDVKNIHHHENDCTYIECTVNEIPITLEVVGMLIKRESK